MKGAVYKLKFWGTESKQRLDCGRTVQRGGNGAERSACSNSQVGAEFLAC